MKKVIAYFEDSKLFKDETYITDDKIRTVTYGLVSKIKKEFGAYLEKYSKDTGEVKISFKCKDDKDQHAMIKFLAKKFKADFVKTEPFTLRWYDIDLLKFPHANYHVDIPIESVEDWIGRRDDLIDIDPDYQRGHVWTMQQKIDWLEYFFKGGRSGREIFWNCPTWMDWNGKTKWENTTELVDGKQRINAILECLKDEVLIFGHKYSEINGNSSWLNANLSFHVNKLKTKEAVIKWYIGMNTGGSAHSEADLKYAYDKLKKLNQ